MADQNVASPSGGPFEGQPSARADLKPGVLYAVAGESGWIYYGQVTPDTRIGIFRRRDRVLAPVADIMASPVMAVIAMSTPSITRALRAGAWRKLGRRELAPALETPKGMVNWPVGTLDVTVFNASTEYQTQIHDPAIQDLEIAVVWDAEHHLLQRLTIDFEQSDALWHIGGPVWRERRVKEALARRFPDAPWHALPAEWVYTNSDGG